jgi:hypothetical protein
VTVRGRQVSSATAQVNEPFATNFAVDSEIHRKDSKLTGQPWWLDTSRAAK